MKDDVHLGSPWSVRDQHVARPLSIQADFLLVIRRLTGQHIASKNLGMDEDIPSAPSGDAGSSGPDERYLVPALIRGLGLLKAFGPGRQEMTLAELAAAIGVTRSAAYRLTYTLEHLGFLRHDTRSRRYALGPEVLRLGYGYLASRDLVEVTGPVLEALRDRTGWSAHLGKLEGTEVVYLARVPTRRMVASNVQPGSRLPAHATAMGRVLLAALPEEEVAKLYDDGALRSFTARTTPTLAALQAQLATDRANGFVATVSGFEEGVAVAAAPVRDVTGKVVAAINVSAVALQVTEQELHGTLRAEVLRAAAELSRALGHDPAPVQAAPAGVGEQAGSNPPQSTALTVRQGPKLP
jgi:DNA-binding IclR family transcriptional regulator